jgi:hypothetical protein
MASDGRRRRLPIARVEAGRLGDLSPAARDRLQGACYELWSEFFEGLTRERFIETHLFDDTWLGAAYSADGQLAGFYNLNVVDVDVAGERFVVITSGGFIRREYDAVQALRRSGLLAVLRVRLRRPFARLAFVPVATTPIAYASMGQVIRRLYPHPSLPTPAHVAPALREVCRRRGLVVTEAPFVVDFSIRQRHVDDLKRSSRMQRGDEYIRAFLARVPGWEQGEALLVWIPGDLPNILTSALLVLRRSWSVTSIGVVRSP